MKQIDVLMFCFGDYWGRTDEDIPSKVNTRLEELSIQGMSNINISIIPTAEGILVSIIYDTAE